MAVLDRVRVRGRSEPPPKHRVMTASALVAAADSIVNNSGGAIGGAASGRTSQRQAWQAEAWGYYDAFPELHYGVQFMGSCLSRIKLRLGFKATNDDIKSVYNEEGEIDEECTVNPLLVTLADLVLGAFDTPLGGRSALLEGIGKNVTMVGECHLYGRDMHDAAGQIVARRWEVLSTDEIRRKPNVRRAPDGSPIEAEFERLFPGSGRIAEDIPLDAFVLRIYRRHPRYSYMADSALRPLLDIMESIVLLVRQMRSAIVSRLAGAGILWIPSEIDFPDDDTAPEGSEEDSPFQRQLMRTMQTPITDRGSASAYVPLVVQADADLIGSIHHLTFDTKDDEMAIAKMDALLQRFAQGMDLPVEVILGHQNTTFANAVQIDEATFKAHVEPLVELICAFLTAGYLWPSMGAQKPVDAPYDDPTLLPIADDETMQLVITYDASALVTHENREQNAIEAMKLKPPIISNASSRRALGFTDADAPDDEERDEWIRTQQLLRVSETIKAEEAGGGGVSLADPDVQKSLDDDSTLPAADDAVVGES